MLLFIILYTVSLFSSKTYFEGIKKLGSPKRKGN